MKYHLDHCYVTSYSTSADASNAVTGPVFLADPAGALRRLNVPIPPSHDPAWRQVGMAIRALEQAAGAQESGAGKQIVQLKIAIG